MSSINPDKATEKNQFRRRRRLIDSSIMPVINMNKKRKFVADGVFYAELNEFLTRQLSEDGYSGLEIRVTPIRTEVIIRATRTQGVLGERGRRIKELTALVQKRFGFAENSIELFVERIENRGLCAIAQCESLRFKLLNGVAVRKAANSLIRYIMESGAKGVEVNVSGKVRGQRAKGMKFVEGFLVHSGNPIREYLDCATRHVLLRQGVLGVKVKIMLPHDPMGVTGPKKPLPDTVTIIEPKDEESKLNVPIASKIHTPKVHGHPMAHVDEGMHRMNIQDPHQMSHY